MSAEFNPASGKLGNVEPLARPERNGRHHRNGNGHQDLPVEKAPRLQVITDDGQAVTVGEDVDPRELAMRLASEVEELRRKLENSENALHDIEREQVQYRAKIRRLENDKQKERMEYVKRAEVEKAFNQWRQIMVDAGWDSRGSCKLGDKRFDSIRKVLEQGGTVRLMAHASLYLARYPFVQDKKGRQPHGNTECRYDDCRMFGEDEGRLEKWAQLGAGIVRREGYVFPWDRPEEDGEES